MPANVIDTNVTIVANGNSDHASTSCELACVEFLEHPHKLHISLDETGLIMDEYSSHLSHSGQPGVGDVFFKYLHDNQYSRTNISLHKITPNNTQNQGFEELPTNDFDPSDRKFLALAIVAVAQIVNATDSDWEESQPLMEQLNIQVKQLCPEHSGRKVT